jgi:hypothetical protein
MQICLLQLAVKDLDKQGQTLAIIRVSGSERPPLLLIMFLLQACRQASTTSRGTARNASAALSRGLATNSPPLAASTKEPSDIITPIQPTRDVMVADVISGAPCMCSAEHMPDMASYQLSI